MNWDDERGSSPIDLRPRFEKKFATEGQCPIVVHECHGKMLHLIWKQKRAIVGMMGRRERRGVSKRTRRYLS